jgi:hypothetical protein
MSDALRDSPVTLRWYLDAARIWALSAEYDPQYTAEALAYLSNVVKMGYNPQMIREDRIFDGLRCHPEYETLMQSTAPSRIDVVDRRACFVNPLPH